LYNPAAKRRMSQDDVTGWLVEWGKRDPAAPAGNVLAR
jgi:hypothetical protein